MNEVLTNENFALQAHINTLREALEIARDYQFDAVNQFHADFAGYKEDKHKQYDADLANTEQALSATPAQSLIEFENEVIERCARAVEPEDSYQDDWFKAKVRASEQIRALKGTS